MFSKMGVVQGGWRNLGVSGDRYSYSFGVGGIKFNGVGSKPSVYGVDVGGESVGGMSEGFGAVEVELKVIGIGMQGNVWVVGKDLEHGEEVNVKMVRTKNITMGNTMGVRAGGGEMRVG